MNSKKLIYILIILCVIFFAIFIFNNLKNNIDLNSSSAEKTLTNTDLNSYYDNKLTYGREVDLLAIKQKDGAVAVDINVSKSLENEKKEIINNKLSETEFMITTTNDRPNLDDKNWKKYVPEEKYILEDVSNDVNNLYVWYKSGNEINLISENGTMIIAEQTNKLMIREEPEIIESDKSADPDDAISDVSGEERRKSILCDWC